MTIPSDLLIEGQHIAPKDFDDRCRRHGQENAEKTAELPTHQHCQNHHHRMQAQAFTDAVSTTSTGLLDGHAFAEWRFDLGQHTHELVDVMYTSSNG